MDTIAVDYEGKFHIGLPLWTIIDTAQRLIVTVNDKLSGHMFPLFTDEALAEEFIEDEFSPGEKAASRIETMVELRRLATGIKKGGCPNVGIDISHRSPIKGRRVSAEEFLGSLPAAD